MEFLRVYGRVLGLLHDERKLAITLAFANVAVAALQFYEPVLLGRVVDLLSNAQGQNTDTLVATPGTCSRSGRSSASAASSPTSWSRCMPTAWRIAGGSARWRAISSTCCGAAVAFHSGHAFRPAAQDHADGIDHLFGIWLGFFRENLGDLRGAVSSCCRSACS